MPPQTHMLSILSVIYTDSGLSTVINCWLCAMIVNVSSCSQSAVMALHCRLASHLTSGKHIYELRQRCGSYLHFIADLLPELIMSSLQCCQLHLAETISSVIINTVTWIQQLSRYNSEWCRISKGRCVCILCTLWREFGRPIKYKLFLLGGQIYWSSMAAIAISKCIMMMTWCSRMLIHTT